MKIKSRVSRSHPLTLFLIKLLLLLYLNRWGTAAATLVAGFVVRTTLCSAAVFAFQAFLCRCIAAAAAYARGCQLKKILVHPHIFSKKSQKIPKNPQNSKKPKKSQKSKKSQKIPKNPEKSK